MFMIGFTLLPWTRFKRLSDSFSIGRGWEWVKSVVYCTISYMTCYQEIVCHRMRQQPNHKVRSNRTRNVALPMPECGLFNQRLFSCTLESRLYGIYIPIFVWLKLSGEFIVCFLIFWTLGGSQIGRLSIIPVIVKSCEFSSRAEGLLLIIYYV